MSNFSYGLRAGLDWGQAYQEQKEKDIEDKLFTAYSQLEQDGAIQAEKDRAVDEAGRLFGSMSQNDIAGAIMQKAMENGLKITDDVARVAYGVGDTIVGLRDKYAQYQEDRMLFNKKMENYNSLMHSRSVLNAQRRGGGSLFDGDGAVEGDGKTTPLNFMQFAKKGAYPRNSKGGYASGVYTAYNKYLEGFIPMDTGAESGVSYGEGGGEILSMEEATRRGFPKNPRHGEKWIDDSNREWLFDDEYKEWVIKEKGWIEKSLDFVDKKLFGGK